MSTTDHTPRHRRATAQHRRTGWRRHVTGRRGPVAMLATTLVAVVGLGQATEPTDAQWSDQAYAQATVSTGQWARAMARSQLIEVDGLGLDVLDLVSASADHPDSPGPETSSIDVAAVESLVGVDLPALRLPLIGDGSNGGLLALGDTAGAGVLNGYAATESYSQARAASGTVTGDGAVDLSPIHDPSDPDLARLDLTALLENSGITTLIDQVISDVSLGLGALASTTEWTAGSAPASEYVLAGAELRIGRPLAGGLATELSGAISTLTETLNNSLISGLQDALDVVQIPRLDLVAVVVDLGTPQISATLGLDQVLPALLSTPLVSADGLLSLDLSTGTIAVDLRQLADGGDLNNLPANTNLLTQQNLDRLTHSLASLLIDGVATRITAAVDAALRATVLTITLDAELRVLLPVARGDVDVVVSIGDLLAGDLDEENISVDLDLLGLIPLGTLVEALAGHIVLPLTSALTGPLLSLLTEDLAGIVRTGISGVLEPVAALLAPTLSSLLSELLNITVNSQQMAGPEGEQIFTVRPLAVELLPILGDASVTVGLASSSVQVWRPPGSGG